MPEAWQSRDVRSYDGPTQHGATVRSFGDIALDPIRWVMASKLHLMTTAFAIAVLTFVVVA